MADQYIFKMENLTKKLGDRVILKDVTLAFFPGAKIGVLGRNGAGKSTILKIMAGRDKEYDGVAELSKGYTVGLFDQEPKLDATKDVRGNVMEGVKKITDLLGRFDEVNNKFGEPMTDKEMDKLLAEQSKLQDQIDALDAWNLDRKVEIAMEAMEVPPDDADVSKLSGGEKRRVALCRLLLESPDLLLLDEPTNHLDAASVAWLERFLAEYKGTVVAVTHDRYFLDNVAEWILEIDRGKGIPFKGNYSGWLSQKAERLRQEERKESARQKTLKRELEWVQTSPKARSTKNKARLSAYERMAAEAEEAREEEFEMQIPPGPHLGQRVIEVEGLSKSFGDKVLFDDLSFRIPPNAIVGVLGPNGAGKTTLFKILTGELKPDKGDVKMGETVKLGYVDQTRESLSPTKNVWEEISGGLEFFDIGKKRINTRAYCAQFNFKGTEQQKKVVDLSGGERNRVQLAKLLSRGLNVIMLDEPTNDLDVDTLRALEEAVQNFAGCAIVTSHDRWFLDRLATHILAFEGEGKVYWCEGNYQVYEAGRRERLGQDADTPHRMKYKKLG